MAGAKENSILTHRFDCFDVHTTENDYSFCHIEIQDNQIFYEKLFDYFFSEEKLIRYCEHISGVKFSPNIENFITLYNYLEIYIDDFNLEQDLDEIENLLESVLNENVVLPQKASKHSFARLDKIGKIGEYIFSCLLYDFFKFDCIIPKINVITDHNMNVYGIDTLFYSGLEKLILFGESKFSISIDQGITLIKKSLKEYEKQIKDEYKLILRNRMLKNMLGSFGNTYADSLDISMDFLEFVDYAGIESIGVPMFIAHGTETDTEYILDKLSKLRGDKILGLDTKYYAISLPIINKSKLIATFIKKIKEKGISYKNEIEKLRSESKR